MQGRLPFFRSFFPHVLEIAVTVQYALYPELTQHLSISLWLKHLGERSIPSDHAAVRVVMQQPANRCNQGKRIPSWLDVQTSQFLINFDTDQ